MVLGGKFLENVILTCIFRHGNIRKINFFPDRSVWRTL